MQIMKCTALGLFSLFGAMVTPATAQNAQLSKEPITLAVGVDPAFSPIFYAKQKNMFEQAGLNVRIIQLAQAADAMDGLVARQNVLAGGSETTAITRASRADIRGLAIFGQSSKFIKLVARPEIASPKDIKKIGFVPGSASDFVTGKMLTKFGIDPNSVALVRGAPPEFPALLSRGDVDAYFLWEPWPTNGVKLGGKVLLTSGDVGYSYNMLIVASGAWLENHAAEAKTVLRVLDQACKEIRTDPEKAAVATQAEAKIPLATARELLKDVECMVRDFTPEDLKIYGEVAEFLAQKKTTPGVVDVKKVMQSGFYSPSGSR